jgi:uncharacterized membrane protein YhfC
VVFFASQIMVRIPIITFVGIELQDEVQRSVPATFAWFFTLALTAGVFEEVGRWLGYRFLFRRRDPRTWHNALMYGTGHAAVESAILVGLLGVVASLASYVTLIALDPSTIPGATPETLRQIEQVRQQYAALQGWEPLLGTLERIFATAFHISAAVLVLQCFLRNNAVAIAWHTLVNFAAVAVQYWTRDLGSPSLVITEGVLLVAALVSIWITIRLRPRQEPALPQPEASENSVIAEAT